MATIQDKKSLVTNFERSLEADVAAQYQPLKDQRTVLRSRVTKAINSVRAAVAETDIFVIEEALRALQKSYEELGDKDTQIQLFMADSDAVLGADGEISALVYLEPAMKAIAMAKKRSRELDTTHTVPSPHTPHNAQTTPNSGKVRLPKVLMPTFSGTSSSEYSTFIQKFNSLIHRDDSLDDVEKLMYLQSGCLDEAKKIADGYAVTAANYQQLRDALHQMFGRKRMVIQSYMESIIDLPNVSKIGLKSFLNSLETAVRSVREYGVDQEQIAVVIIPLIERKLTEDHFKKWKEVISDDEDFSLEKLIKFLHERVLCQPADSVPKQSHPTVQSVKPKPPQTTAFLATQSSTSWTYCGFCNTHTHETANCRKFIRASPPKRVELVKASKLCFKCLGSTDGQHSGQNCSSPGCEKCHSGGHNTMLCGGWIRKDAAQTEAKNVSINIVPSTTSKKLLKTFLVPAEGNAEHLELRAIIDSASDEAWVTADVVKNLGLKIVERSKIAVACAFEGKYSEPKDLDVVDVPLITQHGEKFEVRALVHEGPIVVPVKEVDFDPTKVYPHLEGLQVADKYPRGKSQVDIVIGSAYEEKIRTGKRIVGTFGCDAVETVFGWVLSGELDHVPDGEKTFNRIGTEVLDDTIRKFWEIEELQTVSKQSQVDAKTQQIFEETAKFDDEKQQYVVKVPYDDKLVNLLPNEAKVRKMTERQEARLKGKPELENAVKDILSQQLEQGIIEKVPDDEVSERQKHMVPWHCVLRPGHPTTPIRVVYNFSNKDKNGLSLNDCQAKGPNLLPDSVGLLLKFRKNPIAFTVDVRKMFHQVRLDRSQIDLHRFIAFGQLYRFLCLVFGEKSSPFCAMAVCKLHAKKVQEELPLACEVIRKLLYIDDPVCGADDVATSIETVRQLLTFFAQIHMQLHKLESNSKELLHHFEGKISVLDEKSDILGLSWDTSEDVLSVKPVPTKIPQTKREVLAVISAVFDPLGFQSPLSAKGKFIMQSLWKDKQPWDAKIPQKYHEEVIQWVEASRVILDVPRYLGPIHKILIFCDASEMACATVAYVMENGMRPRLLVSKTRVRPLKVITLPRMELQAAVLGARLCCQIKEHIGEYETILWTDAEIVMNWIQSESTDYKTFAANRISEIQSTTSPRSWQWVPGSLNPADIPSRGIWPLTEEQKELWLHGPEFLVTGSYPPQPSFVQPMNELRKTALNAVTVEIHNQVFDIDRFSDLNRLLNSAAYVFRFIHRKTGVKKGTPDAEERKDALNWLIKNEQAKFFAKDVSRLHSGHQIPKDSKLKAQNPCLDGEGILRMQSRDQTYKPVILSPLSHLTSLLICHCHEKNCHSGAPTTLSILREEYWILRGLQTVKKHTRSCVTCKKVNEPLCQQLMAPLPDFRIKPSHPFTFVGLDYCGPLNVTRAAQKRYVLLFTCAATRAVHLELTRTMNISDFHLAFTRFCSRRGKPKKVISDNAQTFVRAKKDLALQNIEWQFITPRAPWHGAFYERMVRSVKEPLRKVIGNSILNEVELATLLCKVEAMINERPLTSIKEDDEHKLVTPTTLLNGRSLASQYNDDPGFAPTRRLKYMETLESQFWHGWTKTYLPLLMERSKWTKETKEKLKIGSVVLLMKEHQKRHTWPLGCVMDLIRGRDDHVRSVKLLVDGSVVTRPIQHVVPLLEDTHNE